MKITQEDREVLTRIANFEKTMDPMYLKLGWTWQDVLLWPAALNRLIIKGLVRISFSSNSGKNYRLTDDAIAILAVEPEESIAEEQMPIDTSNLFSGIIGHDNIKELLKTSLELDKPVHILLVGPPSIAKTMFLWDIGRVFGKQALPLIGSATSHGGLWDKIADDRPRVLLIDELEKMNIVDTAGLLSLMEYGRIIRTKVGRSLDVQLTAWIIATANTITKLPRELLSRFSIQRLHEYSDDEFIKVVRGVVKNYEGLNDVESEDVASKLVNKTHDIRDAIRVARLSRKVGIPRAIELLM